MSDMNIEEALRWVDRNCYDEATVQRLRSRKVARTLSDEVERLRAAIIQTLNENGHLADGDTCTLIALKRAVPDWELPE